MVIVRILKNTKYEPGVKLGVGGGVQGRKDAGCGKEQYPLLRSSLKK